MIGQMRHKITIKAPVKTPVGGGGVKTTYTEVLTDWCEAKPVKSSREIADYQATLKAVMSFKLRYRDGFMPDKAMIVVYKGNEFTINGIDEEKEQQRFWVLIGVEKK